MHLLWVSPYDRQQRRGGWLAAHQALHAAVDRAAPGLRTIAPLRAAPDAWGRWCSRALTLTTGRRLVWTSSARSLARYAAAYEAARPADADVDAVLFFGVAEHLSIVPSKPSCCYTDSALVPFLETYHAGRRYARGDLKRLARLEGDWMRRQALVFTSSEFARGAILDRYGLAPNRVLAVGIGANLAEDPAPPAPSAAPRAPTVLFVSTDFQRKGGPQVAEAVRLARARLPDLTLQVIGDYPANAMAAPHIRALGWIDKETAAGRTAFARILQESALLLLLPQADLTPIAICEAAAHGLPTLSYAVGGIPEMIEDGRSGWLLPPGAGAARIADGLVTALKDESARAVCGREARRRYLDRWNWTSVARAIVESLDARLSGRSPA